MTLLPRCLGLLSVCGVLLLTAAAHGARLPVRLPMSYASQGNFYANQDYVALIGQRNHADLVFTAQAYNGSHNGIVPAAYQDAVSFAFPPAP